MNNEAEQRAAEELETTYSGIERNAWLFLALSLALVLAVSAAIIRSNRQLFDRVNELANQRRELAQELIATQESTFRSVSRDLHDEFGQILTAVGAMLKRAGRLAPSGFEEQVREVNEVVQESLEKIRALSQSLQPVILDEQGLAPAAQWYVAVFERQTGIAVHYEAPAEGAPEIPSAPSIHVFRILQESLNNIARHARVKAATVRLEITTSQLRLEVRDAGPGIPVAYKPGIGLAGMRERAALIGGTLEIDNVEPSGTRVLLTAPLPVHPGANKHD
jgi:signal transduction histidine kinase